MKTKSLPLVLLVMGMILFSGCRKAPPPEVSLPLPPVGESGASRGWYVQAEYGFSFPIPKGFGVYAPSADDITSEDFDEWARITDTKRDITLRVMTQLREPGRPFGVSDLRSAVRPIFEKAGWKIILEGKPDHWEKDGSRWAMVPYDLKDPDKREWRVWACALPKKDYILWVRTQTPLSAAKGSAGEERVTLTRETLLAAKWYRPVGPRGISLEQYELTQFNKAFIAALESGAVYGTLRYFDDTSPARFEWTKWYRQLAGPEPKGNTPSAGLTAESTGLVINGKEASVFYTLTKNGGEPQRLGFKLSKTEGSWRVVRRLKVK